MMAELNNITQTTPVPTDSGDDSFCPFCAILWIFLKRFFPACIGILVTGAVCLIVGCVLFQCYRRKSRNQFRTQARNNPGENREANDRPIPVGIQHLPLPETPVIQRQKVIRPDVESKHYSILDIDGPKPHHLTDPEVDYIHPVSLDDHSVPIWNTDSVYDNLIGDGWFEHARNSFAYEQPITENTYVELRTSPPTAAQPKQHQIRPVKNFKSAPVSDGTPAGSRDSGLPVIVPVFVTNVKHKPIDRELQNQMQTFQSQRSQTQGQATVFSDSTDDRLKPKQTVFLDQRTLPGIEDDRQPDLVNSLEERTLPKITGHDEGGMKMNVSDDVASSQPDDEDRYASWPVNEPKSHVQDLSDGSNEVAGVTIHKNRNSSIVFVRLSENDVENTDIVKNENESIISPGDSTERDVSSEGNKNVFETETKRDSDEENNETKNDSDEENNAAKSDSDEENNKTKNDSDEENNKTKNDSEEENNKTKSDSEEENNKTKSDSEEGNNKTKSDSEEDNNETKSDSEEENNETKSDSEEENNETKSDSEEENDTKK